MALDRLTESARASATQLSGEIQVIFDEIEARLSPGPAPGLNSTGSSGIVVETAIAGATVARSLTAPAAGFTISNANGVSGNPTFTLTEDLLAVEGISTTGFVKRTASNTWTAAALASSDIDSLSFTWTGSHRFNNPISVGAAPVGSRFIQINKTGLNLADYSEGYAGLWVFLSGGNSPIGQHQTAVLAYAESASNTTNTGGPVGLQGTASVLSGVTSTIAVGAGAYAYNYGTISTLAAALQAQFVSNSGSSTTTGQGLDLQAQSMAGSTVPTLTGANFFLRSSGTVTTVYGLKFSGTGTTATTSYVIYADNTVSFGATSWFIYSLSTAESLLTGALNLGTAGSSLGQLKMAGNTSGTVTLRTAAAAGTWTLTLPTSAGSANFALSTDGAGASSWVSGQTLAGLTTSSTPQFARIGLGAAADAAALVYGSLGSGQNLLKSVQGASETSGVNLIDIATTWNNASNNPTALKLNVTNTNSGATALLFDFQLSAASKLTLDKSGVLTARGSGSMVAVRPGTRSYTIDADDPSGAIRFGRSDISGTYLRSIVSSSNVSFDGVNSTNNADFVFTLSGGKMVFTPAQAGGAGLIQFGRRYSDNHSAVGASVEFWTVTSQSTPAWDVRAPGGGSSVASMSAAGTLLVPFVGINSSATERLTVGGNVFANAATANLYLKDTSTGWQVSSTTVINPQANNSLRSTAYTSGLVGWNISAAGSAEFDNVDIRGAIHAAIFTYNAIAATAGTLGVFKSAAKLRTDVAIPAGPTYGTTTVTVDCVDQEGLTHAASQLFVVNDILRLKDGLVGDTWLKVSAVSDQTTFWRYTAIIMAGTANVTYRAGLGVPDYGQSGAGFIIQTADQTNSPYLQMATHAAGFSSTDASGSLTVTPQLRLGNLNGSYGFSSNVYGLGAGQYGTASKAWFTLEQGNGFRIGNNTDVLASWDISGVITVGRVAAGQGNVLISAGEVDVNLNTTKRIALTSAGVLTLNDSAGSAMITLDASAGFFLNGKMQVSGASASFALGSTPPTNATTGSGMWIDRNVIAGLQANKQTFSLSAADGVLKLGSDLSAAATTSFVVAGTAITYNSEALGAGDVLMGDNSSSKANVHWKKSTGQLEFRGGTTVQAYVDTTGAITAGGGIAVLDSSGLSLKTTAATATNPFFLFYTDGVETGRFRLTSSVGFMQHTSTSSTTSTMQITTQTSGAGNAINFVWTIATGSSRHDAVLNAGGNANFTGLGVSHFNFTPAAMLHALHYLNSISDSMKDVAILGHNAVSGAPTANVFGAGLKFVLKSSTTNDRDAVRLAATWSTTTDASRTSALVVQTVNNAGSLAEVARFAGNGDLTITGLLKAGSGPTTVTSSTGKLLAAAIDGLDLTFINNGGDSYKSKFTNGTATDSIYSRSYGGNSGMVITAGGGSKSFYFQADGSLVLDLLTVNTSITTPVFNLVSTGSAELGIDRANSGSVARELYKTAGTVDWYQGVNSGSDWSLYSASVGYALTITKSTGAIRANQYGAGTLVTDSSGNITASSDRRLKVIHGAFTRGLHDLRKFGSVLYSWRPGFYTDDTTSIFAGYATQDVQPAIPEAVFTNPRTGYQNLWDRAILCTAVNAIGELDDRDEDQQRQITSQRLTIDELWSKVAELTAALEQLQKTHARKETE